MLPLDRVHRAVLRWPVVVSAWTTCAAGWSTALLTTGSSMGSVLAWVVVIAAGVMVPGVAVVRAVRSQPAAVIEDIGWGIPAGCLVALGGWVLGVLSPVGLPAWVLGPAVAAALTAMPGTRSRVLARPAPGWGAQAHLVMAGAVAVALVWMTMDYLRLVPHEPQVGGTAYYPDTLFQLAVVGHLRHSLQLTYPLAAGEPYSYHWFPHAILAHLLDRGPDAMDTVLRLAPTGLVVGLIVLGAVVAREVAGRIAAGPMFAVLAVVTGSTVVTWQTDGFSVPIVQTYWWASLTTAVGWIAILATAGGALAIIRSQADGSTPVALFVPFAVLAAGSKPSNLAVLVGGAGLAWLAAVAGGRPARPALVVTGVLAGLLLAARIVLYGTGDYGLRVDVFGGFERRAAQLFPGLTGPRPNELALTLPEVSLVAVGAALVLLFLPLLARLIGLALLDRRDPTSWFFFGVAVAAVGAVAVFRQPGESEMFFLVSGYPVLLVGSAAGLAAAWQRWGNPVFVAAVAAAVGAATTVAIALLSPADTRAALMGPFGHGPTAQEMSSWRQAMIMLGPLAALTVVLGGGAVAGWWWARGHSDRRRTVAVACVFTVLGTGLLSTALYATGSAPTLAHAVQADPTARVTQDEAEGARWLAAHSMPGDVFATNRVCVQDQQGAALPEPCVAKAFAFAALSGRDAYVGGWAYADRNLDSAWFARQWWSAQPFWDQRRLADQMRAFTEPTLSRLAVLRSDGVRWLVADRRGAPVDVEALDRLASRRFSSPTLSVWEM